MSSLQREFMLIVASSAHLKLPPFIYPNFLIISQFVLAGQLNIAHGERGSNLLHLFTFGFFVWRHSPTEGHVGELGIWSKKLPIDHHLSFLENY